MRKYLIFILIIVIAATAIISLAVPNIRHNATLKTKPEASLTKTDDTESIKKEVTYVLQNRSSMSKLTLEQYYSSKNPALTNYEQERPKLLAQALKKWPGKVISTNTEVQIKGVQLHGNSANVDAYEIFNIVWVSNNQSNAATQSGSLKPTTSGTGTTHKIELEKDNGNWKIIRDAYNDGTWLVSKSPDYSGPIEDQGY